MFRFVGSAGPSVLRVGSFESFVGGRSAFRNLPLKVDGWVSPVQVLTLSHLSPSIRAHWLSVFLLMGASSTESPMMSAEFCSLVAVLRPQSCQRHYLVPVVQLSRLSRENEVCRAELLRRSPDLSGMAQVAAAEQGAANIFPS